MFHMYVGVRAGGGIGDQIEDPAGDEYEIYRIIFDITFFFFVIVILLAIIQGEMHTHLDLRTHAHAQLHDPIKIKYTQRCPIVFFSIMLGLVKVKHQSSVSECLVFCA